MQISQILKEARLLLDKNLDNNSLNNSKLDSVILLSHALNLCGLNFTKDKVLLNYDFNLDQQQIETFLKLVKRRSKHEPTSHIIGNREFFGYDFIVTKDVLDPRCDSESLIEFVQNRFNSNDKFNILELGAGSGCLTITLLKLYNKAQATAIDISHKALEICYKNAIKHRVKSRLQIKNSNLFDILKNQKFDLIISNPPYIASEEIKDLQKEVQLYEPKIALDGGDDGLDFYRKIANDAAKYLKKNGEIILEIGYQQQNQIIEIFKEKGFNLAATKLDLAAIVRNLCFKLC